MVTDMSWNRRGKVPLFSVRAAQRQVPEEQGIREECRPQKERNRVRGPVPGLAPSHRDCWGGGTVCPRGTPHPDVPWSEVGAGHTSEEPTWAGSQVHCPGAPSGTEHLSPQRVSAPFGHRPSESCGLDGWDPFFPLPPPWDVSESPSHVQRSLWAGLGLGLESQLAFSLSPVTCPFLLPCKITLPPKFPTQAARWRTQPMTVDPRTC